VLINRAIPALYNGVSQQPATLRLPSQAEVQVNGWSTVVEGLKQRPPFQHVAKITSSDLSSAYLSIINRDETHRYIIVLTNGNLQVYDMAGNAKTVNFPHGKGYLTASSPSSMFSVTTVADYSFIVNKSVKVVMKSAGSDQSAQSTDYLSLLRALRGKDLLLSNDYSAAHYEQYKANPGSPTYKGSVQSFDYLPGGPNAAHGTPAAVDGDLWAIQGDQSSGFTKYYVIYQGGVWNETVALTDADSNPLVNAIDETTMPWSLVHNADDTFTFTPFSWAPRKVGDETTNPNPSFVGRTINDVFFYQNRLGILAGENVICSRAGDFGNFYRLTVLQTLADQVVDVGASETNVTSMNYAVPFAQGVMLFSDQTQFRLVTPLDGTFSATTVALQVATRYIASTAVRPVMLGSDIYFVSEDDSYARLREYFVKLSFTGQIQTDAEDTTAHVPSYIPKGAYLLAGSNNHDAVFLATSAAPSRLYVYKFYWQNEQTKAQSSWSYWDFGAGNQVLAAAGLDDYLYAVVKHSDGTYIEKCSLAVGANVGLTDNNGNLYDLLLDRRTTLTGVYTGSPSNYTTWTFPYNVDQTNVRIVLGAAFGTPGAMLDPSTYTFPAANQVRVPGDYHAHSVFAGHRYTFTYQFSEQFMLNQNNVAVLSGRLTLRNWRVYFVNTAFFEVLVDSYGNGSPLSMSLVPDQTSEYTGMTVGSSYLITGSPNFRTGMAEFGVYGASTEATVTLMNDTPYPVAFFEAEFEADYNNRGRTI